MSKFSQKHAQTALSSKLKLQKCHKSRKKRICKTQICKKQANFKYNKQHASLEITRNLTKKQAQICRKTAKLATLLYMRQNTCYRNLKCIFEYLVIGGSRRAKGAEAPLNFSDTFFGRWFLTQKRPLG